jgi:single-strand DNA-binding protein
MGGALTMLDGPSQGGDGARGAPVEPQRQSGGFADDLDDDIPFATNRSIW